MDFEAHYGQQEAAARSSQDNLQVRQYNTWARLIRELVPQMTKKAQSSPPEKCDWVYEDGQRKVSWELWREYEDSSRINLMPDGRLVSVHGEYHHRNPTGHVVRTLDLRDISHQHEVQERGLSWSSMSDLYSNIVTMGLARFGLESRHELHGAILQHWGSSWSNYR
ncbi:MAG TPA: hypothetical protein VFT59_00955 [Candidatus Saccharimonadales bacterium]|nr:hypothetical protein [Candidatus Saccharimonadales bacterium]